jgi:nitroreductase
MDTAFKQALEFRHACKDFLPGREIPQADLNDILEAGRLAPSSLGMEPWRFVVVSDPALKLALQGASLDQPQVGGASAIVTLIARVADLAPDSPHVARQIAAQCRAPRQQAEFSGFYRDFAGRTDIAHWSLSQCHFAAAFMMLAAAACGVDSCPIGGFDEPRVAEILGVDLDRERIALLLPLGYRAGPRPAQHRLPLAEIVEFR